MKNVSEEALRELVARHVSWSGVLKELGLKIYGGNFTNLQRRVKEMGLDVSHFSGNKTRRKYPKELMKECVLKNVSYAGVMKSLGVKPAGGSCSFIKNRINEDGIDTSHFLGQKANSGKNHRSGKPKTNWKELLILREGPSRQASYRLRRALIESGRSYACQGGGCNVKSNWLNNGLVLQVHHINNNAFDDRPENLLFLCPNCHSQTKGWCQSSGLSDIDSRSRWVKDYTRRS
jgi:hypothetical protein